MLQLTRPEGAEPRDFAPTRRTLATLFFTGYAVSAISAQAEPIKTDEEGLIAEAVFVPQTDAPLPAYVARPAAPGRYGAVIVVSEVFGVHEYIRDVCRRLAKVGYVAIAPAFFHRAGDPAAVADFTAIQKIVEPATNEQVMGDIGATLAWLKAQAFVDKKRLAITGFCWGGAAVWMACARFKDFRAGAAWYGRLTRPAPDAFMGREDRKWPVDIAGELKAPVLGLYASMTQAFPWPTYRPCARP